MEGIKNPGVDININIGIPGNEGLTTLRVGVPTDPFRDCVSFRMADLDLFEIGQLLPVIMNRLIDILIRLNDQTDPDPEITNFITLLQKEWEATWGSK